MRRLAYVETKDGTEGQRTTGIWNVTVQHLEAMNSISRSARMANLAMHTCGEFGIDIRAAISHNSLDLTNPLVSGLVAQYYLIYVTVINRQQIPPAEDISGQATFWKSHFKMNATTAMADHFTKRVIDFKG